MVIERGKLVRAKALASATASATDPATAIYSDEPLGYFDSATAPATASASATDSTTASATASQTAPSPDWIFYGSLTLLNENDNQLLDMDIKARYIFKIPMPSCHIFNCEKFILNSAPVKMIENLAMQSLVDRGLQVKFYGATTCPKAGCTFRLRCSGTKCTHYWLFQFKISNFCAIVTEKKDCSNDCPNINNLLPTEISRLSY